MSLAARKPRAPIAIDWTEFRLGWKILILALLGIGTGASVAPLYSFGTMVVPIQEAFGWTRGEVQAAISFQIAASVVAIQIGGWLNNRYGLRPVTIISLIALPLSFFAISLNTGSLWQLYLGYAMLSFAGMGTMYVTWTQLTCLWFEKNRGLALAIILCGSGLAALVQPSLLSWAISNWGWRAGFWTLGLLPLLLTLPLSVLWLRSTGPAALSAVDAKLEKRIEVSLPGMTFRETAVSKRFWLLTFALALSVMAMVGMLTNMLPLMRDNGLPADTAARVFGAYGISLILGRVVVGYLLDRLWAPVVAFFVLALPAIGCLIFFAVPTHVPTLVLASLLVGLGAGAEMDVATYMMARYFGLRDYSRSFSLHLGVISLVSAIAPIFFAVLFDRTGSYAAMLSWCTVSFGLSALLMLTLGRYPTFAKASEPIAVGEPATPAS
ncbi:MFS transporter [Stutzerimonas xanthomarina]|jgi:MFS family permease|uniref:MFS transporter n=1 Tax=Stutzerimonas xanthomarina TaxID=271420 RepID=A0A427EA02_9GAMM|nr:MFS transporter [Stutzerimonas xanthomarina]MCW8158419.1 MFS transporter [Stutzerimonas stutzeri]RRV13426.1 MFS transporter [Stutzerimonas xanthomarina]